MITLVRCLTVLVLGCVSAMAQYIPSSGGGGMTLISRQILAGAAANITFSSLPTIYNDLILVISARSSSTSTDLGMRFNGDSGANYIRSYAGGAGSGIQGSQTGATIAAIGPLDFNTDTAGAFATYFITLGNYNSTTFWKAGTSAAGNFSGAINPMILTTWFAWRSTAAVTSIVLAPADGSNLVIGTTASLYGVL